MEAGSDAHERMPRLELITQAFLDALGDSWRDGERLAHAIATIEWLKTQCSWPLIEAICAGLDPREFGHCAVELRRGKIHEAPRHWPEELRAVFGEKAMQIEV